MSIIVYYEGSDAIKSWISALLGFAPTFKKLPTSNNSNEFTKLPAYVADILYLDKPDVIISGTGGGIHERPIFSIELAACTPQYQHAIQRFSRMVASATNGCPSIIIMPKLKKENSGGTRLYRRSQAVDYGAVRAMDIFEVPAFVVDWPDLDGVLKFNGADQLPPLSDPNILALGSYLQAAIAAFANVDYIASLKRLPQTKALIDHTRSRAYKDGAPSIVNPGGGIGRSPANLDLVPTSDLLSRLQAEGRLTSAMQAELPDYFASREKSLVFYPTRVVKKAGDPYVGMLTYYDVAFCRSGKSPRERNYNLVADCKTVEASELSGAMETFNKNECPFVHGLQSSNFLRYSYHLKHGCAKTKIKPVRIYSEIADMLVFKDEIIVNN